MFKGFRGFRNDVKEDLTSKNTLANSPLGKLVKDKVFDKPMEEYDKPLTAYDAKKLEVKKFWEDLDKD